MFRRCVCQAQTLKQHAGLLSNHDVGGCHVALGGVDAENLTWQWLKLGLNQIFQATRHIPDGGNAWPALGTPLCAFLITGEVHSPGVSRERRCHFIPRESVDLLVSWQPGVKVTDDTVR